MDRQLDIEEKFLYATARFDELADRIHSSAVAGESVKFIGSIAGDILSNLREVFDFCARDMFEKFVQPSLTEKQLSKLPPIYYPLYKTQLTRVGSPFSFMKAANIQLHSALFSVAAKAEKNESYPNTLFEYGDLRDLFDMVNEKKHNRLLLVHTDDLGALYMDLPDGGKVSIPLGSQRNIKIERILPSGKWAHGPNYVFEYNSKDVLRFCMLMRGLTRHVVTDLFDMY